jgi:hypothetical protein
VLSVEETRRIKNPSQSLRPPTIVARSVKNCVNVERLADHREKDPIRETLRENAADVAFATDDCE